MMASDLDFFDPLSERFQQSIQLNEYANFANSYKSTPRFYNLNLDLSDEKKQSNLNGNHFQPCDINLASIGLKIDPRSKSGNHEIGTKYNMNAQNPRYINGCASPITKKPFSFTVYKDNNEGEKVMITKMGRFSISRRCHNDVVDNGNIGPNNDIIVLY